MNNRENDFYRKLRVKINNWLQTNTGVNHEWREYILLAPDLFHLLTKLMLDDEVPSQKKIKLGAAIAYFISPIDLIPEGFFGPIGFLDDIAVTALVLNDLLNELDPKIISRNWAGEKDILVLIKTIVANASNMLGSGLWSKLKKKFKF